jgi:hypothetical protein
MNKTIIAVDPGASGGLAICWQMGGDRNVFALPMPGTEADVVETVSHWERDARAEGAALCCYVEKVGGYISGRPSPGSAMFNFGRNVGVIHGALLARGIRTVEVRPQEWQQTVGAGNSKTHGSKWKNHLKGIAQQRFPGLTPSLKTADALLILEHAIQKEAGR